MYSESSVTQLAIISLARVKSFDFASKKYCSKYNFYILLNFYLKETAFMPFDLFMCCKKTPSYP